MNKGDDTSEFAQKLPYIGVCRRFPKLRIQNHPVRLWPKKPLSKSEKERCSVADQLAVVVLVNALGPELVLEFASIESAVATCFLFDPPTPLPIDPLAPPLDPSVPLPLDLLAPPNLPTPLPIDLLVPPDPPASLPIALILFFLGLPNNFLGFGGKIVEHALISPEIHTRDWFNLVVSLVRSFDQEKNNIQAQQKKKMMKSSSSSENKPCCSKSCKKNTDSLNSKITDLKDKLFDAKNMIYHYKLGLAQVESRLAEHRDREIKYCEKIRGLDSKLTGFQTASKDLDSLLESQRLDKNKEGLGYSVVPPPPAQIYSSPKKDMSWTRLTEFADDTITDYSRHSPTIESNTGDTNRNSSVTKTEASPSTISPKPFIKFVKAADRPTEDKTGKVETAKKPTVKYTELYRRTSKSYKIRGNQRSWNNLKSQQLGENFVKKNKACFNCGHFDQLSYDCRLRVKIGRACPKNNNTHKSMPPRAVVHKTVRSPTRTNRPNMNVAQPKRTNFPKTKHSYVRRTF
nr:ubiquitin hydrolase [Tanacetum cinerariifolium]